MTAHGNDFNWMGSIQYSILSLQILKSGLKVVDLFQKEVVFFFVCFVFARFQSFLSMVIQQLVLILMFL